MDAGRNALARLVLVDVTWSQWRPGTDRDRYEDILGKLVGTPSGPEPYGPVYVHQCDEEGGRDPSWVEPDAPYELPPPDECQCPDQWREGEQGQNWALAALRRQDEAQGSRLTLTAREPDRRLLRTRVAMPADRFRAMANCGGAADYWVLIDLRFQWISAGTTLWHTSFSVWSDLPWSLHHCPAEAGARSRHPLTADAAHELINDYQQNSRTAFRGLIDAQNPNTLRVFGRYYQPPGFLVAVRDPRPPAAPGGAPGGAPAPAPGEPETPDIMRGVANTILGTQRYKVLPRAQFKGGVEVFRRFLPDGNQDRPRYLLIPDTRVSAQAAGQDEQTRLRRIQEEAAATGIRVLTDLEAFAASQLDGIDSRMRTRENHLRIYQAVADQAGTLWDALARLLPDSRGRDLEIVQRAIELVHQTLLQGVADLDQLVRNIDGALSHIEITANDITDRFDRELYHPMARRRATTLRRSLRGGYIDRLRRHVRDVSGTASRVTDSYRMLLDTIGLAFDERSAREGDRMQKAGIWLAVGFGLLGLSGVAQATAPLPDIQQPWLSWLIRSVVWLLTFIAAVVASWKLLQLWRTTRQIARAFGRRYRLVREFLADVSTDRLDHLYRTHPPGSPRQQARWQRLDDELAGQFIDAWQEADEVEKKVKPEIYDPRALRARVEAWTLRTLLLTERPRDFGRYPLPILISLYRLCSARELRDWRTAEETTSADSAVGAEELKRALTAGQHDYLLGHEAELLELTPSAIRAELTHVFHPRS